MIKLFVEWKRETPRDNIHSNIPDHSLMSRQLLDNHPSKKVVDDDLSCSILGRSFCRKSPNSSGENVFLSVSSVALRMRPQNNSMKMILQVLGGPHSHLLQSSSFPLKATKASILVSSLLGAALGSALSVLTPQAPPSGVAMMKKNEEKSHSRLTWMGTNLVKLHSSLVAPSPLNHH